MPVANDASFHEIVQRALAVGIAPVEITALILAGRPAPGSERCPECAATLAPLSIRIVLCRSCGTWVPIALCKSL